jgi:hypothetical protein
MGTQVITVTHHSMLSGADMKKIYFTETCTPFYLLKEFENGKKIWFFRTSVFKLKNKTKDKVSIVLVYEPNENYNTGWEVRLNILNFFPLGAELGNEMFFCRGETRHKAFLAMKNTINTLKRMTKRFR